MRVLHIVSKSQRRGAERAALDLSAALQALGYDSDIVALARSFDGGALTELRTLTNNSRVGAATLPAEVLALRKELNLRPSDVVLAHGGHAAEVAALARNRGGPPVVWQRILGFHQSMMRPPRRLWWRFVMHRIDAAVALTADLEAELSAVGFKRPVWIIENFRDPARFVDLDRFVESRRLHAELGVDAEEPLIGFVGHFVEQKRPDRALDVLCELHRSGAATAHLVMVGDGPLRAQLKDDVETRKLSEFVHFMGESDRVERILAGLDVFILTSDEEGIPGVVIEAAMAGCPVVAPDIGGVDKVVISGRTGILTGCNADEIARSVHHLLNDDARRARLSAVARENGARFSSHSAALSYAEHFEVLVRHTK